MRKVGYPEELTSRYLVLEAVKGDVLAAYKILRDCYVSGDKAVIAGSGGSYADSEHIVGELMKGLTERRLVPGELTVVFKGADEKQGEELASCLQGGLSAAALTGHAGLFTAFLNDVNGEVIYAQQLYGYGKKGNVFIGISTSGNAENVMYAVAVTKASDIKTIGLTSRNDGEMTRAYDYSIVVPSDKTFKVQELHLPIYHALCLALEEHFYEV